MAATLYFSRNPNPRLAVAVARHLKADVRFEWVSTFDPENRERFRALNPALLLPILVEDGRSLWEADAIACRLSLRANAGSSGAKFSGTDFWRMGEEMPEMIRWVSWGKANFMLACDMVHFEFGTKQRYGLGPVDKAAVAEGERMFHASARQLDDHLAGRDFLLDSGLSYADFRVAAYLPFNDVAGLPVQDYPQMAGWYRRLEALPQWADPFAGLEAPDLPAVPKRLPG